MSVTVKIHFDNKEAADHFLGWLSNCGEQEYWEAMKYREADTEGDITATSFDYWHGEDEFVKNGEVFARCGRLDKK